MATLLLAFSGLTLFLFHFQKDEKLFSNLTSRLFVDEMTSNTLNMHYSLASPASFGIYDYTPTLPAYSAQGSVQAQVTAENTLAALSALKTDRLKDHNAYLCRLLVRSLENSLRLSQYPYYDEPLSPASGMQGQLPILLAEYTFRTRKDVEDYLALLDQTDEYFASLLAYEQERQQQGFSCQPVPCGKSGNNVTQLSQKRPWNPAGTSSRSLSGNVWINSARRTFFPWKKPSTTWPRMTGC